MRKLHVRERAFVLAGAVAVALFVGGMVRARVTRGLELLDRQIAAKTAEIDEMQALAERNRDLQSQLAALELKLDHQGEGTVLSRLDAIVNDAQLKSRLDGIQPQRTVEVSGYVQSMVDVKFSHVTLGQVVGLLERLSLGSDVIDIDRLSMERRFENPSELDVALSLAAYGRKR